jgi:DNA replication protein DnaC
MGSPDPAAHDAVASECGVCKGIGWLEASDGRRLVRCRCREQAVIQQRRAGSGIPERYRNYSIATFQVHPANESQKQARGFARRFVELYPAVRVAILNELLDTKAVQGVFCDFGELVDRIQASFARGADESADEVLALYRNAELLVLDELGARRPSDFVRDVLYGLINSRYNRRRITIVTTNYGDEAEKTGETLEQRVGPQVRSRLAEMCQVLTLSGEDFRLERRAGRAFK